jgi:SAM-dependent methyltransferase
MNSLLKSDFEEAAEIIISRFRKSWAYSCQFRFALAVYQRVLMRHIPLHAPSLEIGINDGSSAIISHFGKPKFTYGGDMPEENTYESMGLHLDPNFDAYENVVGMDAHEIPFPDCSFNTVITNDLLSYGVERTKIICELVRVLAPGGTLFLSETTGNIKKYPYLLAEVRKVVPTCDMLDDAVAFYRTELEASGMVDITGRTYFDHRLCAMTFGALHRGEANNQIDDSKRGYYEESLRAQAAILADDLAATDDGQGWQVFVTCRKPGKLSERPTPKLVCLSCKATLMVTLNDCVCPQCGAHYRNELGNPYVLTDYTKTYSPKTEYAPSRNMQAVETLLGQLVDRLRLPVDKVATPSTPLSV